MIVTFICYIPEEFRRSDEPQLEEKEYKHDFKIKWGDGQPIPRKGDIIDFDHIIADIDDPWAQVWYGTLWTVDDIFWYWNKESGNYEPSMTMDGDHK